MIFWGVAIGSEYNSWNLSQIYSFLLHNFVYHLLTLNSLVILVKIFYFYLYTF